MCECRRGLRRAAIHYLHFIADLPVPTAEVQVAEALAGMQWNAAALGELPAKKLAATADILREILAATTGMDGGMHPVRLKQLGRHRGYAVPDEYLQMGDPFEGHPLEGVL